jgi:agmatine deiminase
MPAEWERHESTWISWPWNRLTFPDGILGKVEQTFVSIVEHLSGGERVDIAVGDPSLEEHIRSMLSSARNVRFHPIPTADVWIRDYGPIFVRKTGTRKIVATKWTFNAWGNKYDDLLPDNTAGMRIARSTGLEVVETGIVLEGGSIDVDGRGRLLTTEQCLLNRNRNPGLGKREIESKLAEYLGVEEIIWLRGGIDGDDTDGHIDDVARFVSDDTAICMVGNGRDDVNSGMLGINLEILKNASSLSGNELKVVEVPMPAGTPDVSGLPASYANFYIGNSAVLVPVFGCRNDDIILDALEDVFRGRRVVGIDCSALVQGFGAIHCATQQQPSA